MKIRLGKRRSTLQTSRVWQKLASIALAFAIPLAVTTYFLLDEKQIKIDFASNELSGDEYLRPLSALLVDVARHETVSRQQLGGTSSPDDVARAEARIEADLVDLKDVDSRLGAQLKTSAAELGDRGRSAGLPANLARSWESLRLGAGDIGGNATAHADLLAGIRTLIAQVGDTSQLILDPDLDTYYIMDAHLLKAPDLIDRIGRLHQRADEILARGVPSLDERAELAGATALLSLDAAGLAGDLDTAFNEAPNYSKSQDLEPTLAPLGSRAVASVSALVDLVNDGLVRPATPSVAPSTLASAAESAISANAELWGGLLDQEDGMLDTREQGDLDRRSRALFAVLAALGLSVVLTVHVARRLSDPIGQLAAAAALVTSGDLGTRVTTSGAYEIRSLGEQFNAMVASLEQLVSKLRSAGAEVSAAALELSSSSEELAATTTEQSAAITETSATIEELARASASIAETVDGVAAQAAETRDNLEQAETDILDSSERTLSLAERVNEIGAILTLINEISDQTNLLALNAAIEAARAGESGRGFAVVAEEVRRLAERSKTSAADIATIIDGVHEETNATVMAMEKGAKQMQHGLTLLATVAEASSQVRLTTQQQRSATGQVVETMEQLTDASRQVSATTQQIAASAATLSTLATSLETAAEQQATAG